MLEQHTQSMFEYLAPPRRPGYTRPHHQGGAGATKSAAKQSIFDTGYYDRVF